jgi:hypothetical protein
LIYSPASAQVWKSFNAVLDLSDIGDDYVGKPNVVSKARVAIIAAGLLQTVNDEGRGVIHVHITSPQYGVPR